MIANSIQRVQDSICKLVGMRFQITEKKVQSDEIINSLDFRPEVPEYPSGFVFRVVVYSKRFIIHFIPDSYALPLIKDMEKKVEGHEQFLRIARSLLSRSTQIHLRINDQNIPIEENEKWISNWRRIEIMLEKYSADFDQRQIKSLENSLIEYGSKFFSMVTTLMPTEEIAVFNLGDASGLPEGSKTRIEVNKYERNPLNRLNCISVHGLSCKVCNFNFEAKYGPLGIGFIQVHHIIPVSKIGEGYLIDPTTDLVPVCPNCHAMLHRKDPPIEINELRKYLNEKANSLNSDN